MHTPQLTDTLVELPDLIDVMCAKGGRAHAKNSHKTTKNNMQNDDDIQ